MTCSAHWLSLVRHRLDHESTAKRHVNRDRRNASGQNENCCYLYRALDKLGDTIDLYLWPTRNMAAAKHFLAKAHRGLKDWEQSPVINTDKAPTYAAALADLKAEGKCPTDTQHRQVKYLNNIVASDHGKLKQVSRPVRGFKTA